VRGVAPLYSRLQVDFTVMDRIKFVFNDKISLYKKNDSDHLVSIVNINKYI